MVWIYHIMSLFVPVICRGCASLRGISSTLCCVFLLAVTPLMPAIMFFGEDEYGEDDEQGEQ